MKKLMVLFWGIGALSVAGQSVERLYEVNCSSCHGIRFQGGNAQSLIDGVWQFGSGNSAIERNIKNGIPHLGMPGYEKTLNRRETRSLINFLRHAEKKAGVTQPVGLSLLKTLDYDLSAEEWVTGLQIP